MRHYAKAFTLAELMIVLSIIGVLAGILIPIANHSRPDENVMKFKKANTTLGRVIRELVTSDKYYCNGDLGIKADCTTRVVNNPNRVYFCETVADLLSTKISNCSTAASTRLGAWLISNEYPEDIANSDETQVRTVTEDTIASTKIQFDDICKDAAKIIGEEIKTTDDIVYYQGSSDWTFAAQCMRNPESQSQFCEYRIFAEPNSLTPKFADQDGYDIAYKTYCIDIDGIPSGGSDDCDDVKDICPFGYGIRVDGKILVGARAQEWIEKIQKPGDNN